MSSTTFYNSQNLVGIGSVGIGTTSPVATLDIRGQIRTQATAPSYTLADGTYTAQFGLASAASNYGLGAQSGDAVIRTGQPNSSNIFITGSSTFATQFVVQGTTGNVGIGVTNPANILTVGGGGRLRVANSNSDYTLIGTNDTDGATNSRIVISGNIRGTNNGGIEYVGVTAGSGSQGNHIFYYGQTNAAMTISGTTGYVGILQTGPSYALDVTGAIRATLDITAYSDRRVKSNLEKITGALDKVAAINGYTFTRNDSNSDERHAGVIAQEVQEVLPEVVSTDKEGKLSVAYGNMAALLIEALKEEKSKREALEVELEVVRRDHKSLEGRLVLLEKLLLKE